MTNPQPTERNSTHTNHDYAPGDRVVDADQPADEQSPAVVVDRRPEPAGECEIDALERTVASVNPDHPDDDPVVTIAFESDLDANVPKWDEQPADELRAYIDTMRVEWNVSATTYHYPESRLRPVDGGDA